MAKKVNLRLADDIRASLHEAFDYAAGKRTGRPPGRAEAHRCPRGAAEEAEPRAVRRALNQTNSAA